MNDSRPSLPRILHLHSSFGTGGKELRCVTLINAFGGDAEHIIISADPAAMGAAKLIDPAISVAYPADFPLLQGRPTPPRLYRLAQAMRGYDLVLTYNWGAMDAALAHSLFASRLCLPPLVHHEDGFNEDERERLKRRRNWARRIGLVSAGTVIVPSRTLERIALTKWHIPVARIQQIPNAIDVGAFTDLPRPDAIPGLVKQDGQKWVGTMAGLRKVKDLPYMVSAFAALPEEWQLVIVGEGEEKGAIRERAEALGIADRVHLPGFVADPASCVGLFDIFALSSHSEQFPISMLEAMAAGVPVASPAVGDVLDMVSDENRPLVLPRAHLQSVLCQLAADPQMRALLGEANRRKAAAEFDSTRMISRYRAIYFGAMGRYVAA